MAINRPKPLDEVIFLYTASEEYVGRAVVPSEVMARSIKRRLPDLVRYGDRIFKRETVNGYFEVDVLDVESSLME